MDTPNFTQDHLADYKNIALLIANNDLKSILDCIHVHKMAPPIYRQPVLQLLLQSQNVDLATQVFPHLDWLVDRYNLDAVVEANDEAMTHLFLQYSPAHTHKWAILKKSCENESINTVQEILKHNPPQTIVYNVIEQCIKNQKSQSLNVLLDCLIDDKERLYSIALLSSQNKMDCSQKIGPHLSNEQLNWLLIQQSTIQHRKNESNAYHNITSEFELASLQRSYMHYCTNLYYQIPQNMRYECNQEEHLECLLQGAIALNDLNYFKEILQKNTMHFRNGLISSYLKPFEFFVELVSSAMEQDDYLYIFDIAQQNKHMDAALFIYDNLSNEQRLKLEEKITKHREFLRKNNIHDSLEEFDRRIFQRNTLFEIMAENAEQLNNTPTTKRKM